MAALHILIVAIIWFHVTSAQQMPLLDIPVNDLLRMQTGVGWPHVLQLIEGQDAQIQLVGVNDFDTCHVTTPWGVRFDVESPPERRYQKRADGCGVRINEITERDEGRWRMTAAVGNHSYVGWSQVHVNQDVTPYSGSEITLEDGEPATVRLTSLQNSYCYVEQPFSEGSLITGQCGVRLPQASRAVQGNWNVYLGVPGRVQEVHLQRHVSVESERLDAGYVHDLATNKLNLFCNLLHSARNITFCRFQKTSSPSGFNVADGLSDGRYSYYGEGFLLRQCGMSIEAPTAADFGTWRCSVGTRRWVDAHVEDQPPMQALITATSRRNLLASPVTVRSTEVDDTTFIQVDGSFTLRCRADMSLRYCWFQHPNGSQFTPLAKTDENQAFWYEGESLQSGDCGITFTHANHGDTGEWICHMGPRYSLGIEITDKQYVQVTGALAANRKNITANIGQSITLYCHTANAKRSLDYCRFLTPDFVGFNIDHTITEDNAIEGHYYFTPGRQLNYGDCSLTIRSVRERDIGEWTCAGLITRDSMEARDTVYVDYVASGRSPLSRASITGMSVGFSILIVSLAGFVAYKRYGLPQWKASTAMSQRDIIEMSETASQPRSSTTSGDTVARFSQIQIPRRNHENSITSSSSEDSKKHYEYFVAFNKNRAK